MLSEKLKFDLIHIISFKKFISLDYNMIWLTCCAEITVFKVHEEGDFISLRWYLRLYYIALYRGERD